MQQTPATLSRNARLGYGFGCVAIGFYPIALGFGFIPVENSAELPPSWILIATASVFFMAGTMILLASQSYINDFLAGILLCIFGALGTWVSVFAPSEGFVGGDTPTARIAFGVGAVMTFAIAYLAFRRAVKRMRG